LRHYFVRSDDNSTEFFLPESATDTAYAANFMLSPIIYKEEFINLAKSLLGHCFYLVITPSSHTTYDQNRKSNNKHS